MAHGRKRIWAGAVLLGFALVSGAMVVASRWYAFQLVTDVGANREQWEMAFGALSWVRAPTSDMVRLMGAASTGGFVEKLTNPGFDFFLEDSNPTSVTPGMAGVLWRRVFWSYADVTTSLAVLKVIVWPFPLMLVLAGAIALWSGLRSRRSALGQCLRCGYDLSGTPAPAPCPECGGARVDKAG